MARMKVLLLQDVMNVGLAGEVESVAAGFARNYLMPRKMAVPATKGVLKQAEEIRQAGMRRRAQEEDSAKAQAEVIGQQKLLFEVNAGPAGRLYGSITTSEIADKLAELVGFEVERRRIIPSDSIRQLGMFELQVRLMPEVTATFTVAAVREGEGWAEAAGYAQETAEAQATEERARTEAAEDDEDDGSAAESDA